jgi:hypothetical protein
MLVKIERCFLEIGSLGFLGLDVHPGAPLCDLPFPVFNT